MSSAGSFLVLLSAIIFLGSYALVITLNFIQMFILRQFLGGTPSISSENDLERFKRVARLGMYLAICSIPLFALGFLAGLYLIAKFGALGLLAVVAVNAAVFILGKIGKSLEEKARGLDASPGEIQDSYRKVCESWVKKALPDF